MSFDPKKPVQTRDGHKVIIYCTDAPEDRPIHGRVESLKNYSIRAWFSDGRISPSANGEFDLVNIPEKRTVDVWLNVYPDGKGVALHECEADAVSEADDDVVARLHFTWECQIGEGLTDKERSRL